MTKPEQSMLPWTIEEFQDGDFGLIDADGEVVAEGLEIQDARLIIVAVNSHADLLAAAKAMAHHWTLENCMALEAAIRKTEQA